jgi:CBS domain-containing protein
MKKVTHLIQNKGKAVNGVPTNTPVYKALELMIEKNIGALLVFNEEQLVGLFTERDYARKVILMGKNSHDTTVGEIMETNVSKVSSNDSIERCMEIMSDKHIRYLPVMESEKVEGLVSMGDLVRFIIDDQKHTITNLQNYISGVV